MQTCPVTSGSNAELLADIKTQFIVFLLRFIHPCGWRRRGRGDVKNPRLNRSLRLGSHLCMCVGCVCLGTAACSFAYLFQNVAHKEIAC